MFVLDTNTLIYFFKGKGRIAERMFLENPGNIGVPAIVLYELETGIAKSISPLKRTRQLNSVMEATTILPFNEKEAKASAVIRAGLEKKGLSIGPVDILIAGTAVANQGTLVTHNLTEFSRVDGLHMMDWF